MKFDSNRIYFINGVRKLRVKLLILFLMIFFLFLVYNYMTPTHKIKDKGFDNKHKNTSHSKILSWSPRIFYYNSFINSTIVADIIKLMNEKETIKKFYAENEFIYSLNTKIAELSHIPIENSESGYVERLSANDLELRRDWLSKDDPDAKYSNEFATFIIFLNNTIRLDFPKINLSVSPRSGDAILIWNLSSDRKVEENALYRFSVRDKNNFIYVRRLYEKPVNPLLEDIK